MLCISNSNLNKLLYMEVNSVKKLLKSCTWIQPEIPMSFTGQCNKVYLWEIRRPLWLCLCEPLWRAVGGWDLASLLAPRFAGLVHVVDALAYFLRT